MILRTLMGQLDLLAIYLAVARAMLLCAVKPGNIFSPKIRSPCGTVLYDIHVGFVCRE